jgi:ectoine hydroxylase-related dioxygenase (phytanoyl-CoA dioxygenase family)
VGAFPELDFDEWHRRVLPERLETGAGRAAARDVVGAAPVAFRRLEGGAYCFQATADGLTIEPGDGAPTVATLGHRAWEDFVHELATGAGLFYGGRLRFERGDLRGLERWEPAFRALAAGRPILDPTRIALRDLDGSPLEPARSYHLNEPPDHLRHVLAETGFLHLRNVFAADEVARLREIVDARAAAARPGDGRSWWAKRADGSQVLCRLIYLGLVSRDIAVLGDDRRLRTLAALAPEPTTPLLDRGDGHSVVLKPAGVVEGLADLPWHRDCGLGGHPVLCPALNMGIQLDAASAEAGRLYFLPGSHRGSCHRADMDRWQAAAVAVDTVPGDLTVHGGDVLHAAPSPTGRGPGRRALYVTFAPPRAKAWIPAGRSFNDVILAREGGAG